MYYLVSVGRRVLRLFLGPSSLEVYKVDVPHGRCRASRDGDLVLAGMVAPSCSPEALRPWCCWSLTAGLLFLRCSCPDGGNAVAPEALHNLAGTWCHPGSPLWSWHCASASRSLLGCSAATASQAARLAEGLTFSTAAARRTQG